MTGTEWRTSSTHNPDECTGCADAIRAAVGMAKCTGSTGSTYTDGQHVANVRRGATCRWFALCDNDAAGVVHHPVLGDVPTCQRCATTHGLGLDLVGGAS